MEMTVALPLDADGFLRRECPACQQHFKWYHGETDSTEDADEPTAYYCPYCGENATPDQWWTQEQADYLLAAATGPIMEEIEGDLKDAISGLNTRFLRASVDHVDTSPPPQPLGEPDDMIAVEPPCHGYEPLKISEAWTGPIHCLICGQRFVV